MSNSETHTYKMCDMRIYKPVGKKWELVYWWTSIRSITMKYWTERWYATMGYQMDCQELEQVFLETSLKEKSEQVKHREERWASLMSCQLTAEEQIHERS